MPASTGVRLPGQPPEPLKQRSSIMADQPISNAQYNLVSMVYHAGQGAETCRKYITDAQQAGDQDAVAFLEDARRQYEQLTQRGLELLKRA